MSTAEVILAELAAAFDAKDREIGRLRKELYDIGHRDHQLKLEIDDLYKALGNPSLSEMNPQAQDTVLAGAVIRYAIKKLKSK